MTKIIHVTQEDIDQARDQRSTPENILSYPQECPIALALRRELGVPVRVGWHWIKIGDVYKNTSPEIRSWTTAFDNARPVKPFSFDFDLLDQA